MIEAGFGDEVLSTDCGGRTLLEIVRSIAEGYMSGTPNGIVMDKASGLVFSPSHFTWMDTNYPAGTPREGYPIEIQALWYATLRFLALNCPADGRWADLAGQVARSIREYYWDPGRGSLCDNLSAVRGTPAARPPPDDALRPNQLLTLTLGAVSDREAAHGILRRCAALLVPGAIRSLADEAVEHPLPVVWKGVPLNDPLKPYWGRYEGDEDTRRKPAYHNGTAWTWLFPSYPEAMFMAWGEPARGSALALLESSTQLLNSGAVGHVPEILDGDMPHIQRGCSAQAWGSSELYRVLDKLTGAT
jgi:predicted glycogen debranching enzyme